MSIVSNLLEAFKDTAFTLKDNFAAQLMLTNQSTVYWAVQQFIEVNFMEG